MACPNEESLINETFKNNFDPGRFMLLERYVDGFNNDIGVFEKLPEFGKSSPYIEKRRYLMSTMRTY